MACPDPTELARFALRDLEAERLARVAAHVDACAPCRAASSALVTVSRHDEDAAPGDQRWEAPRLADGATFGRYVISHVLGEGAASVVYAAYDPELDRKVALKLLRRREPAYVERQLREGRGLARIAHPNVITVYEVGDVDAQLYIALELVEGATARQWAAITKPSWRAVRDVYVAAAHGLAALHAAGLVHRDIKPDNIVVGAGGAVRVVDLGLVGAAAGAGTPAYMAPELRAGGRGTAASDQYALCAALAEALGDAPASRRVRRALQRGLAEDAAARFPSVDALAAALADRPAWHVAVPAAIGATAAITAGIFAFAGDALAAACDLGDDLLAPAPRAQIEQAFARSTRAHAADTKVRTLARLDAAAARWRAEKLAACEAYHRRGELSAERFDRRGDCLARQRRAFDATVARLTRGDDAVVDHAIELVAALPSPAECHDDASLAREVPLPSDRTARAAIVAVENDVAAAEAAYRAGDPPAAIAQAQRALAAARATAHDPMIARAAFRTASLLDLAGDGPAARPLLDEAIAAAARARVDAVEARAWILALYLRSTVDHPPEAEMAATRAAAEAAVSRAGDPATGAHLANVLGLVASHRGDFAAARDHFARALAAWKAIAPEGGEVAQVLANQSRAHEMLGDLAGARASALEASERDREMYGPSHPSYADSLLVLASREALVGDTAAAIEHAERALAIVVATHGPDGAPAMIAHNNVASTLGQANLLAEAEPHARRSMELAEKLRGPRDPETAKAIMTVANIAGERRDYARADAEAARALAIVDETLGQTHPMAAVIGINRGNWALASGDAAAAERHLRAALPALEAMKDGPYLASARALLGAALVARGKHAEAIALLETALADRRKMGADPLDIADAQFMLARALWATGKRARAIELANEAAAGFAVPGIPASRMAAGLREWAEKERVPLAEVRR